MTTNTLLRWTPRVFGLLFAAFLALFALDVFEPGRPLAYIVVGFLIHLLPTYLVGAATVVGWRNPALGGLAFLALAVAYTATAAGRLSPVTIGVLVGPAGAIAALFLLSALAARRPERPGGTGMPTAPSERSEPPTASG